MEVDGKEFLRNIEIEQNKAKLKQEQERLEQKKRESVKQKSDNRISPLDDDSAFVDLSFNSAPKNDTESTINQLHDIMLEPDSTNSNKKKYIILGFTMILIFIITIVTIRIMSNSSQEDEIKPIKETTQIIQKDKILDQIDTKEEYEKVINKDEEEYDKRLHIDAPKDQEMSKPVEKKQEIILPEPTKEKPPVVIEKPKQVKEIRDLFGLEEEAKEIIEEPVKAIAKPIKEVIKKPIEKKEVKKVEDKLDQPKRKIVVPSPEVTDFAKNNSSKIVGYYVQVGAFTKKPTEKFLTDITKKGYNYTVHQMTIKGKVYNKVLIGAYPTKKTALQDITKIRRDFKNPNAYILKF